MVIFKQKTEKGVIRNMNKIVFFGLYNELNYGDPILAKCTEWLCLQNRNYSNVSRIAIDQLSYNFFEKNLVRVISRIPLKDIRNRVLLFLNYRNLKKVYQKELRQASIAVVVGGGLIKFRNQFFGASLAALLDVANDVDVPVVFNSVGVEGYDGSWQCQFLKKMLQKKSLKYISTRDDLPLLSEMYFNGCPQIPCKLTADSAVWASECYGVKKNENSSKIGIGVCRGKLFEDYGYPIGSDELLTFYENLVIHLKNIYDVEIFTNGLPQDNVFALELKNKLERLHLNVVIKFPKNPQDLVSIISSYKAIAAARLHACIVAYSLNIPAVGLVWNEKLRLWGKNIAAEDFFVSYDQIRVSYVVDKIFYSISKGYDLQRRISFRDTVRDSVNFYMNNFSI